MTRVDPRNGTESTIDLAICNSFLLNNICEMKIDEDGQWKLKKYAAKKVTQTDHNTIILKLKFIKSLLVEESPQKKYNVRNSEARLKMQENIKCDATFDYLFSTHCMDLNSEFDKFLMTWDDLIHNSFQVVRTRKCTLKGVDDELKVLLQEENNGYVLML